MSAASYGGANVHVVLGKAHRQKACSHRKGVRRLSSRPRHPPHFARMSRVSEFLAETPDVSLADMCHTVKVARADATPRFRGGGRHCFDGQPAAAWDIH